MRHGLVGYGFGGRCFHAPYIEAAPGIELVGIVARAPERIAEVRRDWPGMPVYPSLAEMLAAGVDSVTITTPPATRRGLVLEAIAGGVHVVADKPFAPSAAAGRELVAAAHAAGVGLNVYHNRRYDADIRTVAGILARGDVGEVWRFENRFDLDAPGTLETGPDGGLLRDLGTHLVDQALWLLGPARAVHAELDWVDGAGGPTDAAFALSLTHASGARSRLSATKLNHNVEKEYRLYGSAGSYLASGTDVQTAALLGGRRPAAEGKAWGYEDASRWGVLRTAAGEARVPSERGAYQDFYAEFAAAARGEGPWPVPGEEGIRTLEVLDAARASAIEGRVMAVEEG